MSAPQPEDKASASSALPGPALKDTLTLPQTDFPMKANLPQNEPARLAVAAGRALCADSRGAQRVGEEAYILHDGPPYANGDLHLGHALNKVLKDFVVKSKTMAGLTPLRSGLGLPRPADRDQGG